MPRGTACISTSVITDLYILDRSNGTSKQLTKVNEALFSKLNLTEPDDVWYTSFDGRKIQTWVQKPPHFDPNKKYPVILNIHGGPHAAYGYVFDHAFQWMAAKGYIVIYPNPRGSTSYGQDFGNVIQHNYPGDDHKDLMLAVGEVIKRGYVDEKKLGITGGSGGGVLTNHAVHMTDSFKAAVTQRDISDWANWWYTADFAQFQPSLCTPCGGSDWLNDCGHQRPRHQRAPIINTKPGTFERQRRPSVACRSRVVNGNKPGRQTIPFSNEQSHVRCTIRPGRDFRQVLLLSEWLAIVH